MPASYLCLYLQSYGNVSGALGLRAPNPYRRRAPATANRTLGVCLYVCKFALATELLLSDWSSLGPIQLLRVGCRPSLLTKAAIQAAYSLNVGNLRDTGHSAEATPPATMADELTFLVGLQNARFSVWT
jgi:multisubunit Na+/H+ antiporter MnhG subunit